MRLFINPTFLTVEDGSRYLHIDRETKEYKVVTGATVQPILITAVEYKDISTILGVIKFVCFFFLNLFAMFVVLVLLFVFPSS